MTTAMYKRILDAKKATGLTWDEIAREAGIKLASWMTGLPTSSPTDQDLMKMAPVLNTTYVWLKYGRKEND